tara:strand:- start:287 stop:532 length:246 start_codon:yes stop_codon:yes gene_type:complete
MTLKHSKLIKKIFLLNDNSLKKINKNKLLSLEKFNWDSMTIINLITLLDEKYNIQIKPNILRDIKTFKNLDDFLSKKIKKK